MKISRSQEGGFVEITELREAVTPLGQEVRVIVMTDGEFRRLVALGAELLMRGPEVAFVSG